MGKLFLAAIVVSAFACGPSTNGGGDDATIDAGGGPVCTPGVSEACYDGAPGTEGNGPCTGGNHTCDDNGQWGACLGEILPGGEVCANSVDDNCNGTIDEDVDLDGDGYTTCGGDCCDSTNDGCSDPTLVNPGAFEAAGNELDDDCDGVIDNVVAANCDTGLTSQPGDLLDYARALDICQVGDSTHWGIVNSQLLKADSTGTPNNKQYAIRQSFGGVPLQSGASFVVLSTGTAAAVGQTNPSHVDYQTGTATGTTSAFPADFLAQNGGTLPNAPGCPDLALGTTANDPVLLQLSIRTPTNAKSFSMSINFQSSEFPEWTCSPFNDFFVVLLDSQWAGSPANPADKNLAFYQNGSNIYPVGVNLAYGNTGLFRECVNGPTGCAQPQSIAGNITTCTETTELVGTGLDTANPPANADAAGQPGSCSASNLEGGGTGWLTTTGNVNGGELITIRIAIWDTTDGIYDSDAIIDNFQWSVDAAQPGTVVN